MNSKTMEQEWKQLEDRINQFVNRLLNENESIENRSDFTIPLVSQSDLDENDAEDFL